MSRIWTDARLRKLTTKKDRERFTVDRCLLIEVRDTGGKSWSVRYTYQGKTYSIGIGAYPAITLKVAREKRDEILTLVEQGIDPKAKKREEEQARIALEENTVEKVSRDWFDFKLPTWKDKTAKEALSQLENNLFPALGSLPMESVSRQQIIDCLQRIEARSHSTARKVKIHLNGIYKFALLWDIVPHNLMADLSTGVLRQRTETNFNAITEEQLPEFLKCFDALVADGRVTVLTRIAFNLMLLIPVRTSELITAEWQDFDLEKGLWTIPWHKMKMGKRKVNPNMTDHKLPLPRQAIDLLLKLKESDWERSTFIFPGYRTPKKPMSNGAILNVLKSMGYGGKNAEPGKQMTGHGFRSLFATTMSRVSYENGYRFTRQDLDDVLAHKDTNEVQRCYFREQPLEIRKDILQVWADYIDEVRKQNQE